MSHDPVDPAIKTQLNKWAKAIGDTFPGKHFVLLLFDKNRDPSKDEKRVNYIGSTSRHNMSASIHEFLSNLRGTDPAQLIHDTLPVVVPKGTPVGTKLAVVFTTTEEGVSRPELMEWHEDDTKSSGDG